MRPALNRGKTKEEQMAGTNAVSRMPADDFYAQYCDGKAHQDDCSDAIAELCGDKDPCEVSKSDPKLKGFIEAEPVESEPVEAEEGADAQQQLMALLNGGAQAEEASEPEESQPVKKAAPVAGGVSCPESQELKDGKCVDKKSEAKVKGFTWGDGFHFSLGAAAYDNPFNVDTTSMADAVTRQDRKSVV